ncbi:hypothetical protein cypCar_00005516, partial [Cyprinus carpio]
MQGRAGRAARKDAVCETAQQGRILGEMEIEGETAVPIGLKPKVIEPLDYESVLVQRKTQILSDVLRDMLQFPIDDFQYLRNVYMYLCRSPLCSVRAELCTLQYQTGQKREQAACLSRSKVPRPEKLASHVFEVDEDADKEEDAASLGSQRGGVSKHGWLYKGNMNSAISVTMR